MGSPYGKLDAERWSALSTQTADGDTADTARSDGIRDTSVWIYGHCFIELFYYTSDRQYYCVVFRSQV